MATRRSGSTGPERRERLRPESRGGSGQLPPPDAAPRLAASTGVVDDGGCLPGCLPSHPAGEVGGPTAAVGLTEARPVALNGA